MFARALLTLVLVLPIPLHASTMPEEVATLAEEGFEIWVQMYLDGSATSLFKPGVPTDAETSRFSLGIPYVHYHIKTDEFLVLGENEIEEHARIFGYKFPVLFDGHEVVQFFEVQYAPELEGIPGTQGPWILAGFYISLYLEEEAYHTIVSNENDHEKSFILSVGWPTRIFVMKKQKDGSYLAAAASREALNMTNDNYNALTYLPLKEIMRSAREVRSKRRIPRQSDN